MSPRDAKRALRSRPGPAPGALLSVGVADLAVSDRSAATLVTYALGSCVGVAVYDRRLVAGGLLHFMLPSSGVSPARAAAQPAMFADTGIDCLLDRMAKLGATVDDLVVKIAGAGRFFSGDDVFQIGRRNAEAAHAQLQARGLRVAGEDLGGSRSRTLRLRLADGQVLVTSSGTEEQL